MYGFWRNKRLVLFDTLLSEKMRKEVRKLIEPKKQENPEDDSSSKFSFQCWNFLGDEYEEDENTAGMSDNEVVAVLVHELGHWKLWHTLVDLLIDEVRNWINVMA